jgi:hypothetical protein
MTLFFAFVLLSLAAAIVLLFAMMGQLAARLPHLVGYQETFVRPIDEARIGARPNSWPPPLAPLAEMQGLACIMALSTACATCEDVATELAGGLDGADNGLDPAVVISCGNAVRGEDFVKRHRLDRMRCYIDEEGKWLTDSFGVKTSPTALVFRNGVLSSAFVFSDVATLNQEILKQRLEVEAS